MYHAYVVSKDKLEKVESYETAEEAIAWLLKYWNEEVDDQVFVVRYHKDTVATLFRDIEDPEIAIVTLRQEGGAVSIRRWKCTYIMGADNMYQSTRVVEIK